MQVKKVHSMLLVIACIVCIGTSLAMHIAAFAQQKPITPGVSSSTGYVMTTGYHVKGKKIVNAQGKQYIPYGVHSTALFEPNWQQSIDYKNFTRTQIQQAHDFWHANVIDFQVSRANLFPLQNDFTHLSSAYLQAMDTAVAWTTQEQMNVIFTLQTEASTNEIMATPPDILFWQIIANRYKNNQRVFFDLFNEPRDFYSWSLWQNGGTYKGVHYVGMQQLVNTIRATGANNLILAQGQGGAEGFDYANFAPHVLRGKNIVYAIHPYFSVDQHATQSDWETWWGKSVQDLKIPFVIGEWNVSPGNGCMPNAPTVVPLFLRYIQKLHIGLIAWALAPGMLIHGNSNPNDPWNWDAPTQFNTRHMVCVDEAPYPDFDPHVQGAGELILQFLRAHSSV